MGKTKNLYEAFEVYEMMLNDIITRNPQFFFYILKDLDKIVDVRDIVAPEDMLISSQI